MSALDIFRYDGADVRVVVGEDGEPWFVASDVARSLGYRMASDLTRRLDDDEKGTRSVRTPGGEQRVTVISESGLWGAALGSQVEKARPFSRWVRHDVLPTIRRTGSYGAAQPAELTRSDLARMVLESEAELAQVTERAEVAETFRAGIEQSDGLSVRAWHKHYLPDLAERAVFEMFYRRGLLIDQRGQRQDQFGRSKAGKQHGHPTYAGKAFFYLHPYVDPQTGDRHEHTRVRPGTAEAELADWVRSRIGKAA